MIFDPASWNRFFKGFTISRCVIADKDRYMFIMLQHPDPKDPDIHPQTKFLHVWRNYPLEKRFAGTRFDTLRFARAGVYSLKDGSYEFVAVDMDGYVYVRNETSNSLEKTDLQNATAWKTRAEEQYAGSSLERVKRINGEILVVGLDHHIFRRKRPGQWEPFPGIQRPKALFEQTPEYDANGDYHEQPYSSLDFGFSDISAFGPKDIYAVGGHGDVWRYDGHTWTQCDFPSNELVYTVCCAGDGKVYISGHKGSVWVGRSDTWKPLIPGKKSIEFKDSAWFADRMWFGGDYGLFELKNDALSRVEFPNDPFGRGMMAGYLDVSIDGKHMLTAGIEGAALFDGEKWEPLFNISDYEPDFDKEQEEEDEDEDDDE